jgi:hypothetical protein
MRGSFAICAVALTLSCSSGAPAPAQSAPLAKAEAAPSVTPEELTMAPGHVALGSLVLEQDGKPGLILRPNGSVELPGQRRVLGKLGTDGRFVDAQGVLLARLTDEGEVVLKDDEYLPVTLSKNGELRLLKENRTIVLNSDGTLAGVNPKAPVVTIQGVTPRTQRTALFLLVLSAYPVRSRP